MHLGKTYLIFYGAVEIVFNLYWKFSFYKTFVNKIILKVRIFWEDNTNLKQIFLFSLTLLSIVSKPFLWPSQNIQILIWFLTLKIFLKRSTFVLAIESLSKVDEVFLWDLLLKVRKYQNFSWLQFLKQTKGIVVISALASKIGQIKILI